MTHYAPLWIRASLLAVMTVFISSHPAQSQTTLKCRTADQTSAGIIAQLVQWGTTTNAARIKQRDSIFHVPAVSANQVTLVTDERICAKVIQAYATLQYNPYTPTRLYVFKLGSKGYAGYDPDRRGGEFTQVVIVNTKFVDVGGWSS